MDNPAINEVIKAMAKDVGRAIGRFSLGYIHGTFAVPTYTNRKRFLCHETDAYDIGGIFGCINWVLLPVICHKLSNHESAEHLKYFLKFAAATNIASGLYEWVGKNLYEWYSDKSYEIWIKRQKLPVASPVSSAASDIEPEKKNGLEKIAEANPAESDFTDPWSVDIPKIERRKN